MDREIKEELEKHKQEKIELVRKELAWESEKQRIALEILRKRYRRILLPDKCGCDFFISSNFFYTKFRICTKTNALF